MNRLQRMIAFAARYNLAWDDPDFDRKYDYLSSAGHEQASRVAAARSEGHELGCPPLYDGKYAEAYEYYHKEGATKAAEKGLVAGYAEDFADDYAAKYAHFEAYSYTKTQVKLIMGMLKGGLSATMIHKWLSIPKSEIDVIISTFNPEDYLEERANGISQIVCGMLSNGAPVDNIYECVDASRADVDAIIAKIRAEN